MKTGNHSNFSSGLTGGVTYSFCIGVLVLLGSGCTRENRQSSVSATEIDRESVSGDVLRLDLGCIQRGDKVEFCIPLSKLGIASHAEIRSIKSSCECVKVQKMLYRSQLAAEQGEGLLVSISPAIALDEPPVSLRVQVEIESTKSERCLLELDFLETDFVSLV